LQQSIVVVPSLRAFACLDVQEEGMDPPEFASTAFFNTFSGLTKRWRPAQKIPFLTRKGVLASGGGAAEPAAHNLVQICNLHAVSTNREGSVKGPDGTDHKWKGRLKLTTKRQMVTQLVQRRDVDAGLFCIAGDTNFKSFEEARSITAEAQDFSIHASRKRAVDDCIFAWGSTVDSEDEINWVPDELRNACFTSSGKHQAVWVKLVAKSKSQVVHPPRDPSH
jgi:hypothetical protein